MSEMIAISIQSGRSCVDLIQWIRTSDWPVVAQGEAVYSLRPEVQERQRAIEGGGVRGVRY